MPFSAIVSLLYSTSLRLGYNGTMSNRKKRIWMAGTILCALVCAGTWLAMGSDAFGSLGIARLGDGGAPLDMRPGYTPEDASTLLTVLGTEGRAFYQRFLLIDLAFIASFAWLQVAITRGLAHKSGMQAFARILTGFCLARAGFDLLEDSAFILLIARHPSFSEALARAAGLFTWLKFALLVPWLIWLAAVGIRLLRKSRQRTTDESTQLPPHSPSV